MIDFEQTYRFKKDVVASVGHQFSYLAFTKSVTLKVNLELAMYILGACIY